MVQQSYVLGVGSTIRGDDGIGPKMVDYLDENKPDRDFELVDVGGDGLKLLHYLDESVKKILVVDSAFMGLEAGEYRFFSPEEVTTCRESNGLSTHGGDVIRILEAGKKIGYEVPPLRIMGIEPISVEQSLELSETLQNRMPDYARAIAEEIQRDWN